MRTVVALSLVCCFVGCDDERATSAPPALTAPTSTPVAVVLQRTAELPRFEIQATFGAIDPAPHIQPIAAALATARAVCSRDTKPALAAVIDVDVSGKHVRAVSRNSTGTCLAHEIDGKAIADAASYHVELLVSAG